MKNFLSIILILYMFSTPVFGQHYVDFETGPVFSGYNDVRIPGDTGTDISLTEDLDSKNAVYYRIQVAYSITPRQDIVALAAPLRVSSSGMTDQELFFNDTVFPAQTNLEADYRFDSYRLTYRYNIYKQGRYDIDVGLTVKLRDASITLKGEGIRSEKDNVGFVPLLHFKCYFSLTKRQGFLLETDALAAQQGRAEDVLLCYTHQLHQNITGKLGYRLLEGGADNDEVYTFSAFHYIVFGLRFIW